MLPRMLYVGLLVVASLVQAVLLADLVSAGAVVSLTAPVWSAVYGISAMVAAFSGGRFIGLPAGAFGFKALLVAICTLMPVIGPVAGVLALFLGERQARRRNREPDHWSITRRAELPFTTPRGRQVTAIDGRGFEEHLMYSNDADDLYRKVLSAANIPSALSVSAFKVALRHKDERIRLTAYNLLDRKVTDLNRQIQALERQVSEGDDQQMSNTWLQIASNYWELLTLEKGEPVARRQLLDKAAKAAIQSIVALPINRNAHFLLGRVSVLQGDVRRAAVAFQKARALGMPSDKVLPYLAEVAFMRHDFAQVKQVMDQLDPSVRAYPPLSHVAEYWS